MNQDVLKTCITQALDEVGFPDEVDQRKIEKAVNFISRRFKNLDGVKADSEFFDFKGKIERAANLIGTTPDRMANAALDQPQMFCQSSKTLNDNITAIAKALGVEKDRLVDAALRNAPSLFCRDPHTIKENLSYISEAHRSGYFRSDDLTQDILSNPTVLTLAKENTRLRAIEAHVTGVQKQDTKLGISNFYKGRGRSKANITETVVQHYTDQFNEVGKGKATLERMAEQGIITAESLPDFCDVPDLA